MRPAHLLCAALLSLASGYCLAQGPELCVNGGFEQGVAGWVEPAGPYGRPATDWNTESSTARLEPGVGRAQSIGLVLDAVGLDHESDLYTGSMPVREGYGYRLGAWVRMLEGDSGYKVTIDWQDAEGHHLGYANDWQGGDRPRVFTRHGGVFAAPPGAVRAVLILGVQSGTRYVFDEISLREVGPAEPLDARPRHDGDGTLTVEGPAQVVAGEPATWRFVYTAGPSGLPVGGLVQITRDNVDFSWGKFQRADPAAEGYVSVSGPQGAEAQVSNGFELTVRQQWPALQPGESLVITAGDTSAGGPGLLAQVRPAQGIGWRLETDCDADGKLAPAPVEAAPFDVAPGPLAAVALVGPATARVGETVALRAEARDKLGNVAAARVACVAECSDAGAALPGEVELVGEAAAREFTCRFATPGLHTVTLRGPAGSGLLATRLVVVSVPGPAPTDRTAQGVLGTDGVAAVAPRNPFGYGYVALWARGEGGWTQLAALPSLGQVTWAGGETVPLYATTLERLTGSAGEVLLFSGETVTPGGAHWPFTVHLSLRAGGTAFGLACRLEPTSDEGLLGWSAPRVLVGEGGVGETKRGALFPGLEYLGPNEDSSSDAGVAWALHERSVPNPYKITLPMMAVALPAGTVSVAWDPTQRWCGERRTPLARFASPNREAEEANHELALGVPYLPQSFRENQLTLAEPWAPGAGQALELSCEISLLAGETDVAQAVSDWAQRHPLPPVDFPRSPDAALGLCARGYSEVCWSEADRGWLTAIGLQRGFHPGIADETLQLAARLDDPAMAQRLRAQEALAQGGRDPGGVELALRQGRPEMALQGLRREAAAMAGGQSPRGTWTFAQVYDTSGQRATLAAPDDIALGTCVSRLQPMLRYALATGDADMMASAVRGLEALDRFAVPAGAESWEVPLCNPNLRAAALACDCFRMAYLATGERQYLDRARKWAWAGLAFIYLWQAPDRPVMPGASISVFGTTYHTHPWFGAPVQWVGLVYARVLQDLAATDDSYAWGHVADLIVGSALRQQKTETAPCGHVGLYPDSYSMVKGADYYEWCLAPSILVRDLLASEGGQPDALTVVAPEARGVRVTSVAQVSDLRLDAATGCLTAHLRCTTGPVVGALVCGMSEPARVLFAGRELPRTADADAQSVGWFVPRGESYLALRLPAPRSGEELRLEGVRPQAYAGPRLPAELVNGGFERGEQGWVLEAAARIVAEPVHGGSRALRLESQGLEVQTNGDPFAVEPGRAYRLSAWVRQLSGQGGYKVTLEWQDANGGHLRYDNDWQGDNRPATYTEHGGVFQAPDQARMARLIIGCRGEATVVVMDDLSLTPVP